MRKAFRQTFLLRAALGATMLLALCSLAFAQPPASGKLVARELYDHKTDPQENENIAGDAKHATLLEELAAQMRQGWRGALPKK